MQDQLSGDLPDLAGQPGVELLDLPTQSCIDLFDIAAQIGIDLPDFATELPNFAAQLNAELTQIILGGEAIDMRADNFCREVHLSPGLGIGNPAFLRKSACWSVSKTGMALDADIKVPDKNYKGDA